MDRYANIIAGSVVNVVHCTASEAEKEGLLLIPEGVEAGVGSVYHSELAEFRPVKPYDSWRWGVCSVRGGNSRWLPPIPFPSDYFYDIDEDPTSYEWDETNQQWIAGS